MNNMYDILNRMNLLEGKGSKPDFLDIDKDGNRTEPMKKAAKEIKEDQVEEGSTGDYSAKKARAGKDIGKPGKQFAKIAKSAGERYGSKERGEKVAGAVLAKLRKESVEEAKGSKPDFLDMDKDGDKTEPMKKAVRDKKAKAVKESIRLVKEAQRGERRAQIYHDRDYNEYTVCLSGQGQTQKFFTEHSTEAVAAAKTWLSEGKAIFPGTDEYKRRYGSDIESFRLRHAPSVMKDPESRKELSRMDTEHERLKKLRRGEIDPDEVDTGAPAGEKRGRGRPKGSKRAIGAKGPTGRSKLMRMEEDYDKDEYDEEGEMAKSQARTIEDAAQELQDILDDDENLPEWVQKKINLAKEYIDSARDYMKANPDEEEMDESALQAYLGKKKYGEEGMKALQKAGREGASKEKMAKLRASHDKLDEEDLEEKAVSKAQRAAAGIAHAARKGDIPKSELRGASKEMAKMPAGELKKFAKTKEKGLPEKVKEEDKEEVEETTTSGSVATAPSSNKATGIFGKGVYEAKLAESFDQKIKTVMTESVNVTVNANSEGSNTVTVTGHDVAPDTLMDLLKMAGMGGAPEQVYQPVQAAPADMMSGMLDTLDGIAGEEEAIPEAAVCEVCGGHEGMHEAGCSREMAMEADLANSADNTETMDTDYMVNQLAGGLNGPKTQVNPNNMGDNPLAMPSLGKTAHSINLGAVAEDVEQQLENRLMDLYKRIS
jgi:hypothetical protein